MAKASGGRVENRSVDASDESVRSRALIDSRERQDSPDPLDDPLPERVEACIPTLVSVPPAGDRWWHEIKWDGYRHAQRPPRRVQVLVQRSDAVIILGVVPVHAVTSPLPSQFVNPLGFTPLCTARNGAERKARATRLGFKRFVTRRERGAHLSASSSLRDLPLTSFATVVN
jgi:hypothetical protein